MFTTRNRPIRWFHQRSKRVRTCKRIMFPTNSETVLFSLVLLSVFVFRRLCKMLPRARIWTLVIVPFEQLLSDLHRFFRDIQFYLDIEAPFYSLMMQSSRECFHLSEASFYVFLLCKQVIGACAPPKARYILFTLLTHLISVLFVRVIRFAVETVIS